MDLVRGTQGWHAATIALRSDAAGQAIRMTAAGLGFEVTRFDALACMLVASRRHPSVVLTVPATILDVRWRIHDGDPETSTVTWVAYRILSGTKSPDLLAMGEFGDALGPNAAYLARQRLAEELWDPVIPPGGRVPPRWRGQIWDYSGLLTPAEAFHLRKGVLPLGSLAFGWDDQAEHYGQMFLPMRDAQTPLEEFGVLVCAPQGTGKTHLLLNWATAAAAAGRSVFFVDVKGDIHRQLLARQNPKYTSEVLAFTTDPDAHESARVNFLAGISVGDADCFEQMNLLAEAILPYQGFEGGGEEEMRRHFSVTLLRSFIALVKLREWYAPETLVCEGTGSPRGADLTDICDLLNSEDEVKVWIARLLVEEKRRRESGAAAPNYTVRECLSDCATALSREYPKSLLNGIPKGQEIPSFPGERPHDENYRQLVWPLRLSLEQFGANRPVGKRVRDFGPGEQFRLEKFGFGQKAAFFILAAREQDSRLAATVLSIAVNRLIQVLRRRFNETGMRQPVLLLFDETARIAGFDPATFVTMMRAAHVGYVFVYQHLALIGKDEYRSIVMANIGAQLYLNGIQNDADYDLFIRQLPKRTRERWMPASNTAADGSTRGETLVSEEVPMFDMPALQKLPGGERPALVYLGGLKNTPAFIVDLDDRFGEKASKG